MGTSPLISIIVPAYNVELLLPECLDSIIRQRSSSIEVILIDNGSTDSTSRIINQYIGKISYFKTASIKENKGPGAARNAGISMASGIYIFFCDADDMIPPGTIKRLASKLQSLDCDIFVGDYFSNTYCHKVKCIKVSDEQTALASLLKTRAVWNMLFKRSFLDDNNLQFEECSFGEDSLFLYAASSKNPKVFVSDLPIYHHVNHNSRSDILVSSLTNQFISENVITYIDVGRRMLQLPVDHTKTENAYFLFAYVKHVFTFWKKVQGSSDQKRCYLQLRNFIGLIDWSQCGLASSIEEVLGIQHSIFAELSYEDYISRIKQSSNTGHSDSPNALQNMEFNRRKLKSFIRKKTCYSIYGWWFWRKFRKTHLEQGVVSIFMPSNDDAVNFAVLRFLENYLDTNGYKRAVLMASNQKIIEVADSFCDKVQEAVVLNKRQRVALLDYYSVFNFDKRFIDASLSQPFGRNGDIAFMGKNNERYISKSELVVRCVYKIKDPKQVVGDIDFPALDSEAYSFFAYLQHLGFDAANDYLDDCE